MGRYFVILREKVPQTDQVKVWIRLGTGFKETLNPRDLGLRTIEYFQANPITREVNQLAWPIGSLYHVLGTPERTGSMSGISQARGGQGSGVLIVWVQGTTGTRIYGASGPVRNYGTAAAGTRNATAFVIGRQ